MSEALSKGGTRRQLLGGGLALGSTVALAGSLLNPHAAVAANDAQLLVPLVGSESLAAFTYGQVLDAGMLSPRGERLTQRLLAQEQQHLETLVRELKRQGGTAPAPIVSVSDADRVLTARRVPGSLADLHNEHDTIILLARIEWLLEGAYYAAISKLRDPRLLRLSAQVMANEAQHGTMLSELLHPGDVNKAVPSSYVLGTR
jgi:Ferritin-like domain